ncbi:Flagellum site-determining protein YlxH [Caulifigura coniformis]|uniref:Iron-sulfur cluster carrier protein n=1 Tax=Caulifigura coniformis TaxID=2527983 RepID=A0A517S8C2_9PLAN|nr:Mrp/NBP35 family ATP-binding protein [Caulifigura coniformis]QDT52362.1 Flagellum site-determining protein YlxH [Caulifigura coniformis]
MSLQLAEIRSAVEALRDPELNRTFAELKYVRTTEETAGGVRIEIVLPTPAYPQKERISTLVKEAASRAGAGNVEVILSSEVRGKNTGASVGLSIKNIIAVGSGKGGVGKSTIATALAYGLKHFGASVGLMDADVYGPSVPHLVGAQGQPAIRQIPLEDGRVMERIIPIEADGLKLMSMGFMLKEDQAVIWRGPMLHKALTQFLQQTDWGQLDYLIIDMPPGTGDVAITLSQMVGLAGAIVVCTPQQVALLDAIKAINMYRTVKIPILGMVENMSGEIFGRGGAQKKAQELGIPFLGEVPSDASVRIKGDEGRMSALFSENNPARPALEHVTSRAALELVKQLLAAPAAPMLEII